MAPIEELTAQHEPFHLTLAGADLSDRGMAGGFEEVAHEGGDVLLERLPDLANYVEHVALFCAC